MIDPVLTVSVSINGNPLYTRSCVNRTSKHRSKCKTKNINAYEVDDGRVILHNVDHRAVKLAIEMLKGIKEA